MVAHIKGNFSFDEKALVQKMKLRGPSLEKGISIARNVAQHAAPWFACKEYTVDSIHKDGVTVAGVKFHSAFLPKILEGTKRVFVYVVTCGTEMASASRDMDDIFDRYIAEGVEHLVLDQAKADLETWLHIQCGHSNLYHANPGSIGDWSTLEIRQLFELLEKKPYNLGMTLTNSGLMQPSRSVSGLYFESKTPFANCMICKREGCPNRRAPFDKELCASFAA